MVKKVVDLYYRLPKIQLGATMKLAGFSDEEYDNIVLRRIIQRALPDGSIKSFMIRLMRYESSCWIYCWLYCQQVELSAILQGGMLMMIPVRMMIIMKQKSCQTMLTTTRNNTTINLNRTWDNGRQRGKTMTY
jgi:hypothetical protein